MLCKDMMGLAGRYSAQPSPLDEEELQVELAAMEGLSPTDYARILAERKAHAMGVALSHSGDVTLIVGSDTIVDLDGSISECIVFCQVGCGIHCDLDLADPCSPHCK